MLNVNTLPSHTVNPGSSFSSGGQMEVVLLVCG